MRDLALPVLAWLAVSGATLAAILFGQSAKGALEVFPVGYVPSRIRLGIAVSITGPLLGCLLGLAVGLLTAAWLWSAVLAFLCVLITSVAGWVLAPR